MKKSILLILLFHITWGGAIAQSAYSNPAFTQKKVVVSSGEKTTWNEVNICQAGVFVYFFTKELPILIQSKNQHYTFKSERGNIYNCKLDGKKISLSWRNGSHEDMHSNSSTYNISGNKVTIKTIELERVFQLADFATLLKRSKDTRKPKKYSISSVNTNGMLLHYIIMKNGKEVCRNPQVKNRFRGPESYIWCASRKNRIFDRYSPANVKITGILKGYIVQNESGEEICRNPIVSKKMKNEKGYIFCNYPKNNRKVIAASSPSLSHYKYKTRSINKTKIEDYSMILGTNNFSKESLLRLSDAAVRVIRAKGWRCDSIASMRPYIWSRGFNISCNHFAYSYEFEDQAGRWKVKIN